MATIETIQSAVNQYATVRDATNARRQTWHDETKEFIYRTLTSVKESIKTDWYVDKNELAVNLESVYLSFHHHASGIIVDGRAYRRKGGCLCYSLVHNGKISAWISCSYTEHVQDEPPIKPLAIVDPSDITEQMILEHVETMVRELRLHEEKARTKIGFHMPLANGDRPTKTADTQRDR